MSRTTAPAAARGATVWLTGLPSAGKSTIARTLAARLAAEGHRVEVLDGDEVRGHLSAGLGYSRADRDANVRRIGWVAALLARNGVKVLAPVIAPYADTRRAVRDGHEAAGAPYLEVHVATPARECATRDVKGLYARQARGEVRGLTGVDAPYEEPSAPEARVETTGREPERCAAEVYALLAERRLV